jgi:thiol:disulfide interchange protein DsbD
MTRPTLLAAALLWAAAAPAAPVPTPHVEAELVAEHTGWIAGATNWVALRLKPEAGWHTYWRNPGDSGLPTTLAWTLPENWKAGDIAWPYPSTHRVGELTNYGYDTQTLHLVPLEVPAGTAGEQTVRALAKWLVCKDICIPGQAELALTLPVSEIATADPVWAQRFADTRQLLPQVEPLAGHFAIEGGEVRLQVDAVELAGAASVEFYPYADDLLNHAAQQRVALEGTVARFAQAQSPYLNDPPRSVDGVVVVQGSSEKSAYTVAAQPGEVATVAKPAAQAPAPDLAGQAQGAVPDLWLALGFALLGGLILNLMPCVFPVLSIKAVSVLESRRGDAAAERLHALAYTAGVVLSCVAAALAIILLREGGQQLGWGFQLQSPVFVALLAYLMLALGLSLSGLVQFGTRLMGVGQELVEQGGYAGSFFTGVLAVIVASPCTAPFMGTALGFALTQPLAIALLVFAALGVGLALPFLLLGFFPKLGAWLPRPGHWMETFKQVMAFPLYLTVVGLLWVLGRQTGVDAVAIALCGLVLLAFALWLWGSAQRGIVRRALAAAVMLGALGLLAHPAIVSPAPRAKAAAEQAVNEAYSDARLAELRAAGRIVFVNFTADWCITCKVNEKVVFENASVKRVLAEKNVAWLTADWTTPDPAITAALERFGRSGVPLYLLYPPEGEPEILPQILTPDSMIEAVNWVSSLERK